jgi:polar amino acid transport system substrate-binding protein
MQRSKRISFLALVLLGALLLVAAGCGSSGKKKAKAATGADKTIAAEVPSAVKSKGTLTVASDASYAPDESIAKDGHTVIGMDPDLAQALAQVMGLKANVVNAGFDTIIPGIQSGKFDLGMSSFGDTKKREETLDFVTYFQAGTAFYVKASGGPTINTLADLCGHKVALEVGTTQKDDATKQNAACKSSGKSAVTILAFPDQNGANLALSSGRAEVGMADSQVASYIASQSNGQFKTVGKVYGVVPYGIAMPKGNGMAKPVRDALKKLISNGAYTKILNKWGIVIGAIKTPVINGATS